MENRTTLENEKNEKLYIIIQRVTNLEIPGKAGICTKDFTVSRTATHSLRQFLLFIVLPSHCYHLIT